MGTYSFRVSQAIDTSVLLTVRFILWWIENSSGGNRTERLKHGQRILGLPLSLERLLNIRARYQEIKGILETSDALAVYQHVWQELGTLQPGHPLYLPPIYLGNEQKSVLQLIMGRIRRCEPRQNSSPELFESFISPIQAGNFLLGGVKGVGKTTLMRAVALAVAITSPDYFLIFINLMQHGQFRSGQTKVPGMFRMVHTQLCSLRDLLRDTPEEVKAFPLCPFVDVDARAGIRRLTNPMLVRGMDGLPPIGLGIILDEVQELEHLDREVAGVFLGDIQMYAREVALATVIASGSSLRIREIVGKVVGPSTVVHWNGHVADFYYISAVRTPEELQNYLQTRYPNYIAMHSLDDAVLRAILHVTGGIGRHIDVLCPKILAVIQKQPPAAVVPELIRVGSETSRKLVVDSSLRSPEHAVPYVMALMRQHATGSRFEEVVAALRDNRVVVVSPEDVEAPVQSIVDGVAALIPRDSAPFPRNVTVSSVGNELLLRLVDAEVLYIKNFGTNAATVQLAVPADAAVHFVDAPSTEDLDRLVVFAKSLLLAPGEVNAGLGVERLVFPRLSRIKEWAEWTAESDVITDRSLIVERAAVYIHGAGEPRRLAAREELHGKTWLWHGEVGLDGMHIEFSAIPKEIRVHGWQGKTGHVLKKFALGSLETYRPHLRFDGVEIDEFRRRRHKNVLPVLAAASGTTLAGSAPYSNVAALLVRAEQGFLTLCSALQAMFPRYRVRVMGLLVTTTKEVDEKWRRYFSTVELDPRHVSAMGLREKQEYAVCVRSGFGWLFDEVIESDSLKLPLRSAISVIEKGVSAVAIPPVPARAASRVRERQGRQERSDEEEDDDDEEDDDNDDWNAGRAGPPPNKRSRFRRNHEGHA